MKKQLQIRNSTAEFLIFTGQAGENGIEVRVEGETVWLTQRLIAELFAVTIPTINEHMAKLFESGEISREATIRNFLIVQQEGNRKVSRKIDHYYLDLAEERARRKIPMTMEDWAKRLDMFLEFDDREILQNPGKVTAKIAKAHAKSEFEKYRIVQDRLFESDFDRHIKKLLEGEED